jgi:hypothetical protein
MLAEDKKLHVVEFRKEKDYFPTVMASPVTCRKQDEIKPNEVMDYTQVMCHKERNFKSGKMFLLVIIKITYLSSYHVLKTKVSPPREGTR